MHKMFCIWHHDDHTHRFHVQVKSEITEIVNFLRNPRKFLSMGARSPAGILLVGPPGAVISYPCPFVQKNRRAGNRWLCEGCSPRHAGAPACGTASRCTPAHVHA